MFSLFLKNTKNLLNLLKKLVFATFFLIIRKIPGFYWLCFVGGLSNAAQKMKFSIKVLFSKYEQIRSFLQIWSYLLNQPLMENFVFCAV